MKATAFSQPSKDKELVMIDVLPGGIFRSGAFSLALDL